MGSIIERLRDCDSRDTDEAADMLEFLFQQFQSRSLKMNGMHSWRFHHHWPWVHAKGPNIEAAVRRAMEKVQSEKEAT